MTSEPEFNRPVSGGHQAQVFKYGQDALKLYQSHVPKCLAFQEAAALAIVEALDVPAPRLRGEVRQFADESGVARWGVIMSWVEGPTFAKTLCERSAVTPAPDHLEAMACLHLSVHTHRAAQLPALKTQLGDNIRKATKLGKLNDMQEQDLLDRLAKMPESDWLCHGDFQPSNVIGRPGNAWIVDWPDATRGEPAVDVCQSYLLMQRSDPQLAFAYVEAYANESGLVPDEILAAWLAIVAGARLADDVPNEVKTLRAMVDGNFTWHRKL
jgi:Ser/Thr protein kinase RdoA (MazF antagonist)